MNILLIGDIVGRPGRELLRQRLPALKSLYDVDMVIANAENAAGGKGLTSAVADELYNCGIDVLTMGNHTWANKEIMDFIDSDPCLIRPANYPTETPGKGFIIYDADNHVRVAVVNLIGRVFMDEMDCPFVAAQNILKQIPAEIKVKIVDFHAEITSEKVAMGWYLNGKVSAVIGTHTHVQTADERVLPQGTAFISDAGMTGPRNSVLGVKSEIIVSRFLTRLPARFELAEGSAQINGVIVSVNEKTGKANGIKRIFEFQG